MYAINRSDGGVTILNLVGEQDLKAIVSSWEQSMHGVIAVSTHEITDKDLPDSRWRNAWEWNNAVQINTEKAKALRLQELKFELETLKRDGLEAQLTDDNHKLAIIKTKLKKLHKLETKDMPTDLTKLNNWQPD